MNGCVKLTTLFISNNRIKVWDELTKLSNLENFVTILLVENPIYGSNDFDAVAPKVVPDVKLQVALTVIGVAVPQLLLCAYTERYVKANSKIKMFFIVTCRN